MVCHSQGNLKMFELTFKRRPAVLDRSERCSYLLVRVKGEEVAQG